MLCFTTDLTSLLQNYLALNTLNSCQFSHCKHVKIEKNVWGYLYTSVHLQPWMFSLTCFSVLKFLPQLLTSHLFRWNCQARDCVPSTWAERCSENTPSTWLCHSEWTERPGCPCKHCRCSRECKSSLLVVIWSLPFKYFCFL